MHLRKNQQGNMDPLLLPLIVSVIFVVGLAGFGIWSYLQYLDQRDNVEQIVADAVSEAEVAKQEALEAEFAEREKSPFDTWVSASSIGSIEITYPKTWSAFVDEKDRGSKPLSGFFHPRVVPADDTTRYALRILVDESRYTSVLEDYDDGLEDGLITATPITVAGVDGIRFDGQIDKEYKGAIVIFALRDKTVRIWTESEAYLSDFNDTIIANLTFEK
jgi:hypothetical protein